MLLKLLYLLYFVFKSNVFYFPSPLNGFGLPLVAPRGVDGGPNSDLRVVVARNWQVNIPDWVLPNSMKITITIILNWNEHRSQILFLVVFFEP